MITKQPELSVPILDYAAKVTKKPIMWNKSK